MSMFETRTGATSRPTGSGGFFAPACVLVLGVILRLGTAYDRPLWWDDLHSLFYAMQTPEDLWNLLPLTQYRPLYFALLQPLLPYRDCTLVLRLPGILASLAALIATFIILRRLAGPWSAVLAALALACGSTQLLYANEVRFYGLQAGLLLGGAAVLSGFDSSRSSWRPLAAGLLTGLALTTATFSLLWIPGQLLLALVLTPRGGRGRACSLFLLALAPFLVLSLLDLARMTTGINVQQMGHVFARPGLATMAGWFKHSILGPVPVQDTGPLSTVVATVGLLAAAGGLAALAGLSRDRRPMLAALAAWILIPLVALVIYSHVRFPIFQHRYLLPSGTLLAGLATAGLAQLLLKRRGIAFVLVVVITTPGTYLYATHPSAYELINREESSMETQFFRPLDASELAAQISKDDVLVADGIIPWLFLKLYPPGPQRLLLLGSLDHPHLWGYQPFVPTTETFSPDSSLPLQSSAPADSPAARLHHVIISSASAPPLISLVRDQHSWNGYFLYRQPMPDGASSNDGRGL